MIIATASRRSHYDNATGHHSFLMRSPTSAASNGWKPRTSASTRPVLGFGSSNPKIAIEPMETNCYHSPQFARVMKRAGLRGNLKDEVLD